jgi:ankyrin repeat protein
MDLWHACFIGNEKRVQELLESGSDANVRDENNCTPILDAVFYKNYDICSLLIEYGADVNAKDNASDFPLIIACRGGNLDFVKLLLKNGADINLSDNFNWTILEWTIFKNKKKILKYILQNYSHDLIKRIYKTSIYKWYYLKINILFDKILILVPFLSRSFKKINKDIIRFSTNILYKTKNKQH